ncbi:MAG: S-layer homology domain-containing protein [Firmicutes bacterium]|nr:S-layer homology domain-containing protein [Bacillota bacterium]
MGKDISVYEGTRLTFTDSLEIPIWAQTAVAYCNYQGLITGMPGNIFSSDTTATRAQVATIMQRLSYNFSE